MNNEQLEALKTADEYLYNLKDGVKKVSQYIDEGREQEGINLIPLVADGLKWLIDAVQATTDVQKEKIETENMNEFLGEIVEALENEDYILVGDLFNYEIHPILEEIHEKIRQIIAA